MAEDGAARGPGRKRIGWVAAGACALAALGLAGPVGCGSDEPEPAAEAAAPQPLSTADRIRQSTEAVDDARLRAADGDAGNWLSYGRTYSERRFSPLTQVNDRNASRLRLAWRFPTGLRRGHEATPIVVDGVMYVTGSWSVVFALEAATGRLLWKYDPQVSHEVGRKTCCDVVNRGVALYEGRVYVGVLDGRLVALDAATGEVLWERVTVDQSKPYTITGAPRVVKGKVIIGNGGAEFGVRGYVSAYDAETGDLVWRTFTVPGDPSKPFESDALEQAAETWKGGEWWKVGGGGTVWDAIAFDPELDLLYVGTGNGSPWSRTARSPGGGDNLYLSSILALDPDTGELRWYYQTTPGDSWDYTATQQLVLSELNLGGAVRKVIMQAPKNGFFYVLDRATGELLSAENYVPVTWASDVDLETGRPVSTGSADYSEGGFSVVKPSYLGGHNWQPMSYNPITGLVYIPAQDIAAPYGLDPGWVFRSGEFNLGIDNRVIALWSREIVDGYLLAWDPVAQREVWRHPHGMPWNGGTLTTAGNLVFEGTADGRFLALRADDGKLLWTSHSAGTGIIAAPVTYLADGTQYVTIVAGWGGAFAQVAGDAAAAAGVDSEGVVLTYALGDLQVTPEMVQTLLDSRPADRKRGEDLYHVWCARCHGATAMSGGVNPDLRDSLPRLGDEAFVAITLHGLPGTSMPPHAQWLSEQDAQAIRDYVRMQAAARQAARGPE